MSSLPGGGKAYDYGYYTQKVPPPHFNVLTASDKRLLEYDLPTRHSLGARWYAYMSRVRHFAKPTPYLVGLPYVRTVPPRTHPDFNCLSFPDQSCTWAGWAAVGHSYNFVGAVWYEPRFASDSCNPTAFVEWTGIGGFYLDSEDLGQDGTTFGVPGLSAHQAFIETISNNSNSPVVGVNLTATKGQQFIADADWIPSESEFNYEMSNRYTGAVWSGNSRKVSVDERSAEVIGERPIINGSPSDLSNFQSFEVDGSDVAWGTTGSSYFATLPSADTDPIGMYDSSANILANATNFGYGSDGPDDFSMQFDQCS